MVVEVGDGLRASRARVRYVFMALVVAYIVMVHILMAYVLMAYIVMA